MRRRTKPEPDPILIDWLFECLQLVELPLEMEEKLQRLSDKWYAGNRLAVHEAEWLNLLYEDYT